MPYRAGAINMALNSLTHLHFCKNSMAVRFVGFRTYTVHFRSYCQVVKRSSLSLSRRSYGIGNGNCIDIGNMFRLKNRSYSTLDTTILRKKKRVASTLLRVLVVASTLYSCFLFYDAFGCSLSIKIGSAFLTKALPLFLVKAGFPSGLVFTLGFAKKVLLASDTDAYLGNMVLPSGSGASTSEASVSVNPAPGGNNAGPSNAGPSNAPGSPWGSFPSVPEDLSSQPSDASIPSLPSSPNEREPSVTHPSGSSSGAGNSMPEPDENTLFWQQSVETRFREF